MNNPQMGSSPKKNTPKGKPSKTKTPRKNHINSIRAFHSADVQARQPNIKNWILDYLKTVPSATRRGMAAKLGKEPGSLCHATNTLTKMGLIAIVDSKKCPRTGKTVDWYALPLE